MAAAPILLSHESSLRHETGAHPERPARIVAIERELERRGGLGWERRASEAAAEESLLAVHPARHVESIRALCARGGGHVDLDTVVSEGSWEAALHAAGGAIGAVEAVLGGAAPVAFSAHRPPGHHAETSRAMGFCLFNNVAVGARHAIDRLGVERVLILDWDVHHGNGTNDVFHDDDRVLFVSIHQMPLYPGTGSAGDEGSGPGLGYTVNLPVPPGTGDDGWLSLVSHVAVPLVRAFAPGLVLVSAGYDAHRDDPLAGCRVSDEGFFAMAAAMRAAAAETDAPLAAVLEGGYELDALARSAAETLDALGRPEAPPVPEVARHPLADAALARLRAGRWPGLGD